MWWWECRISVATLKHVKGVLLSLPYMFFIHHSVLKLRRKVAERCSATFFQNISVPSLFPTIYISVPSLIFENQWPFPHFYTLPVSSAIIVHHAHSESIPGVAIVLNTQSQVLSSITISDCLPYKSNIYFLTFVSFRKK